MRILHSGESHMDALTTIIEGFPSGFTVDEERINCDLSRRQMGYGRGDRMKIESDRVEIYSGIIDGKTIGSPITMLIRNRDVRRASWNPEKMGTIPRPGHAELPGSIKFNHNDMRLVTERASARQTASWVVAGSLFNQFLEQFGIKIIGYVESIGTVSAGFVADPFSKAHFIEASPFRTVNPDKDEEMKKLIDRAKEEGDTLGGIFVVTARGCPPGLGSYTHPDRRIDAAFAAAFMGIPSVKGVEIGAGFRSAEIPGSRLHDIIKIENGRISRETNNAGGIEGGMTNGQDIVIRAAAKPIPTTGKPLPSVDVATMKEVTAPYVRSDVCAVPAISVIGEALAAEVICRFFLERFGGDNMKQVRERYHREMRG